MMDSSEEANVGGAQVEMPKFDCFKRVWALKIRAVEASPRSLNYILAFENEMYAPKIVQKEWVEKHNPKAGGYLVVYKDGYTSYSPSEAFEEGYTPHVRPSNKEIDRMMSVVDAGHRYDLHMVESGVLPLIFIKKQPGDKEGELILSHDGVTTEGVLDAVIHRLKVLNERNPDKFNNAAITHLEVALGNLEARTADRKARGVEGTNNK